MTTNIDKWALEGIRTLVATYGVDKAAKALGIAREAMVRVLAGLPVRKGTVLVILEGIRNTGSAPPASPGASALQNQASEDDQHVQSVTTSAKV